MSLRPPEPPPEGPTKVTYRPHGKKFKVTFHFHRKPLTKILEPEKVQDLMDNPRWTLQRV